MIRQIATLLTGNVLSQLVNIATVLFVITAYFAPGELGRYAVLMSYVGILSSVACLRYELSVVSVSRDFEANNMVFGSVAIATLFSFLIFLAFHTIAQLAGDAFLLGTSPLVIVVLIYLKSISQICASILYRREAYLRYSTIKLFQAVVLLGGFWVSGTSGSGVGGLLHATILAYATFIVAAVIFARNYAVGSGVRTKRIMVLLRRHGDFAKFSAPQTLIDNLLVNGLNFVLIALAGSTVVGYFNYMQKTLKAPLGIIFGAVSQVVFRFSAKNVSSPGLVTQKLQHVLLVNMGILACAATGVWVVYLVLPNLEFLDEWIGMREYMLAFAVWMLIPFTFSPFATLPVVYRKQKEFFKVATSFNLLSLTLLAFIIWSAGVTMAFWAAGLLSLVYFAALNSWLFRLSASGLKS